MGIFGGDNPSDVLDLTYLQKRGLLKKEEIKSNISNVKSVDGFIDLTSAKINNTGSESAVSSMIPDMSSTSTVSTAAGSSGFDFGFMDSPAKSVQPTSFFSESSDVKSNTSGSTNTSNDEIKYLRIKIDDIEYKLARLMEKIDSMISSSAGR